MEILLCGPDPRCEHEWDGLEVEYTDDDGEVTGASATCSKCGISHLDFCLWEGIAD